MNTATFSYLASKTEQEFEECGWKDDASEFHLAHYLQEMSESLRDMASIEREADELVKYVHSSIRYY